MGQLLLHNKPPLTLMAGALLFISHGSGEGWVDFLPGLTLWVVADPVGRD